ncbi:hypothetical protein AK812_SmicGene10060, partial [Symbiodinium microadriaticum]
MIMAQDDIKFKEATGYSKDDWETWEREPLEAKSGDARWAPALRQKEGCGAAATARRPSPVRIPSFEPVAACGDDIPPDAESDKMDDASRTVMDEVRRALRDAMRE